MEETTEEKDKRMKEEVKKRCPFDKTLRCAECRLYQTYAGGRGDKCCIFLRMTH